MTASDDLDRRAARRAPGRAIAACAALLAATAATAGAPHPFSVQDLVSMDRVSDHQPSPAGDRVAFVVRTADLAADRGRTDLWLVDLDGSNLRRLTSHEANDSSPRWSPDGAAIYFLSTRSGSSQVWRIAADGGEAQAVTDLPLDVSALLVAPDGARLAVALEVFPDCPSLACTIDRLAQREGTKASGQVHDRLFVRHWDAWSDGRRSHLFVLPVAGGEPVDVTRGLDADVPSKPFGGAEEIAFAPGGDFVVFSAKVPGREEAWSTDFDLWLSPVDATAPPRRLTSDNPAWDTRPLFSPDGRSLAWLAMSRPGYEADRFRIMLAPWSDGGAGSDGSPRAAGLAGPPEELASAWDRSPDSLAFAADGRTLYAAAADFGTTALFALDVESGEARKLQPGGHVRDPLPAAGGRLVFGRESLTAPVDLWSTAADGSDLRQLTTFNRDRLAAARVGEPEHFSFRGASGDTVWAWLVKPVGLDETRRYPLALLIHGGPQGSFGDDFHYRWNPQVYAGAGFAALMIDVHGSTGYGQAFTDAINRDWGGKPLEDLKLGLAAALERYPWIDGDRACALGASYGGYMINWIAGQWPDRFRCLVNHDGIFDLRMNDFSTEELWFPEWEFGGPYWQEPESRERHNPVHFVDRWRTPMLVIHGGLDFRLPLSQGIATFTALQRRGIASRFLHFPDENHWVLRPANSIQWHEEVIGWLRTWAGQVPAAAAEEVR